MSTPPPGLVVAPRLVCLQAVQAPMNAACQELSVDWTEPGGLNRLQVAAAHLHGLSSTTIRGDASSQRKMLRSCACCEIFRIADEDAESHAAAAARLSAGQGDTDGLSNRSRIWYDVRTMFKQRIYVFVGLCGQAHSWSSLAQPGAIQGNGSGSART